MAFSYVENFSLIRLFWPPIGLFHLWTFENNMNRNELTEFTGWACAHDEKKLNVEKVVFKKTEEIVSDHLDQIGSGPKSWGQPVVPTYISPKNLLRGPHEGLL